MALFRSNADSRGSRHAKLSHDLLHGLPPDEFHKQANSLDNLADPAKARLRAELTERLETPVDAPSWGPDWINEKEDGKKSARSRGSEDEVEETAQDKISRNMERSRQVHHFRFLYFGAVVLALSVALLAMFVDYQIIRGDVWTRALSNEFMVVPDSLQSSVLFKSMQVLFAVLIVHFMLKISGNYFRNALITAAFVVALVMIGSLGYLVAYNNMAGATSATAENADQNQPQTDSINKLLDASATRDDRPASRAAVQPSKDEVSVPLPALNKTSLANADSWVWFAFATGIFFIVTTVAALFMIIFENNLRNLVLAGDYPKRRRHMTQLHMLDEREPQAA